MVYNPCWTQSSHVKERLFFQSISEMFLKAQQASKSTFFEVWGRVFGELRTLWPEDEMDNES